MKLAYNEERHIRTSNYFWLLIFFALLIFFPIFSVFFRESSQTVFRLSASVIIIWGAFVVTQNRKELLTSSVLAFLAMLGLWINEFISHPEGVAVFRALTSIAYFSYLGWHIALQLLSDNDTVNLNMVYGAVVVFFIIGIVGGDLAILLDILEPNTFLQSPAEESAYSYYYFSFVTLTTIGYGDLTPNNESGQALALLIGLFGQVYMTITMAIVIGKYLNEGQLPIVNNENDKNE